MKDTSCYITDSTCSIEYGLRCYSKSLIVIIYFYILLDTGSCTNNGEIRLVNGTIEQEGRIEICLDGVWGGICKTGWGTPDAAVFCNALGYKGQSMI